MKKEKQLPLDKVKIIVIFFFEQKSLHLFILAAAEERARLKGQFRGRKVLQMGSGGGGGTGGNYAAGSSGASNW